MNINIGCALKTILERLKESNKELDNTQLPNNCCNCKFRHGKEYYDQQWGRFFCGRNWCGKDRNLMDTGAYNFERGVGHEFISNCEFYEEGEGRYDKIPEKEKESLPH